jgi:hypothetical protein
MPQPNCETELRAELARRIMVIDGAMGTTIRGYGLTEADVRGERFAKAEKDVKNDAGKRPYDYAREGGHAAVLEMLANAVSVKAAADKQRQAEQAAALAAAEAAIGLAVLVTYFRNRGSIAVEDINVMKG